jgi:gamma-glutamylcyclotransferase (GGCT)/AIG2-like uncharacterized protein YtfP
MEYLFSYGTLQKETVQLETFGRLLTGIPDILARYELSTIMIEDENVVATSNEVYHPIIIFSNNPKDIIRGILFKITKDELNHADEYETNSYKRVKVQLESGKSAWVYIENT